MRAARHFKNIDDGPNQSWLLWRKILKALGAPPLLIESTIGTNMSRIDSARTKKPLIHSYHNDYALFTPVLHWLSLTTTCDNHGAQFQANLVMDNFALEFVAHKIAARNLARAIQVYLIEAKVYFLIHFGVPKLTSQTHICPTHPNVETSKALGSPLVCTFLCIFFI